jgi:hypothetical protein
LGGGGGGGGGGFGISEIFGGGGGGGIGLFGVFAVILGGAGGGGIDLLFCENTLVENNVMKASVAAQKVNFPIEIFQLRCYVCSFP